MLVNDVTATAMESAPAKAPDGLIEVRVTAIRYAARDTHLYEFTRPDGKPLPTYEPGAHIDLHLPNGLTRQYSLINAEPDPATYTVGIKRDPASRGGSRYVHDELRVGKTLKIGAPRNNFALVESAKHIVLFAGGIGITPIWCMVQRLERLGRSWALYYACRSRSDMAFLQSLEAMAPAQFHFDDEFADNIEGHDRARAAGHPDHTGQHYAWMLGGAIGQLKAKNDWELRAWYQYAGQFALDPNLVDSDIYDSRINERGVAVKAGYMVADAISLNLTWAYAWRLNGSLGTGGNGDIPINPLDQYQIFQADMSVKF